MAANTTPDNIAYPTGTDKVGNVATALATLATTTQTAITNRFNGGGVYRLYATKTLMNAAPGTIIGQHATVNADSVAGNNGDYTWSGSAWVQQAGPYCIVRRTSTALAGAANTYTNLSTGAAWASITGESFGLTYSNGITISVPGIYSVEHAEFISSSGATAGILGIGINMTSANGQLLHAVNAWNLPSSASSGMETVRLNAGDKLTLWGYGYDGTYSIAATVGAATHWGARWLSA
jgi:hypothetical protein